MAGRTRGLNRAARAEDPGPDPTAHLEGDGGRGAPTPIAARGTAISSKVRARVVRSGAVPMRAAAAVVLKAGRAGRGRATGRAGDPSKPMRRAMVIAAAAMPAIRATRTPTGPMAGSRLAGAAIRIGKAVRTGGRIAVITIALTIAADRPANDMHA